MSADTGRSKIGPPTDRTVLLHIPIRSRHALAPNDKHIDGPGFGENWSDLKKSGLMPEKLIIVSNLPASSDDR